MSELVCDLLALEQQRIVDMTDFFPEKAEGQVPFDGHDLGDSHAVTLYIYLLTALCCFDKLRKLCLGFKHIRLDHTLSLARLPSQVNDYATLVSGSTANGCLYLHSELGHWATG